MKMRKLAAVLSAAAVAVTSFIVSASAASTALTDVAFNDDGKLVSDTSKDSYTVAGVKIKKNDTVTLTIADGSGSANKAVSVNDVAGTISDQTATSVAIKVTSVTDATNGDDFVLKGTNITISAYEIAHEEAETTAAETTTAETTAAETTAAETTAAGTTAAETTAAGTTAAESTTGGSTPPADEGTKTVLSSAATVFDNSWGSAIEIAASSLSSVKAGDKLTFTVSAVEATPGDQGKKIGVQDAEWHDIGDGIYIEVTDPATKEYTITAAAVDKIKGGIKIKGVNITISEVALITYASPAETTTAGGSGTTAAPADPNTPNIRPVAPGGASTEAPVTTAAPEVVTAANGESVEAPKDVIPQGAVLEVKEQPKEEAVKAVEAIKSTDENKEVVETIKKAVEADKAAVLDINLVKDGAKVQPDGTIKVTINVPAALKDAANLFVYRVEEDGKLTDVKASVVGGKLVFSTSHFSTYIITSEALTGDAVVTEAAATTAAPAATEKPDDKNQATGVILAVIPAVIAAAGVVASKKRK